jgi:hypothetical protein
MTKDPFTPQALDVLCREAGQQAAGWGAGQAAAANAAPASWLTLSLIGGGSVLAVVVLASSLLDEPALPRSAHPAAMQTQAAAAAPLHTPEANAPAQPIRWEGDDLVIDLDRVALTDAVALLARATGTSLTGAHLLTAPTRLTLHLRTRDVNAAWQHLLQGHASFSTSCSATACQVWISSEVAASSLPPNAAPAHDGSAPLLESEREPMTDERREELVSQPDGAC